MTRFRPAGSGGEWQTGQPLMRVEPGSFNEHQIDPGNLLAGSLFDLTPDTDYQVHLSLYDPDGGSAETTLPFSTAAWPRIPENARLRHVVPGNGGGSGSLEDPFRGIAAADAAASPGDLFLLGPGVYTGPLVLQASGVAGQPIIWNGTDRTQTVIDGQLLPYSVIDLPGTHDVQFRDLTIKNPGKCCIRASGTRNVAVIDCRLEFTTRSGREMCGLDFRGARHENVFVSGNEIVGPLLWEEGRHEDHYGVMLVGKRHVVRYNRIHGVFDAVMIGSDRDTVVTSNCDLYGNEIFDCTDDGVEFDASRHNIRCYDNRVTNVLCGFSCQPVYGGPIYMLRNVVYNWQLKPLKFHVNPTGMIVVNNTLVGADERGWGGGQWRHAILRNNLILGGSTAGRSGPPVCLSTAGVNADLDFNGWYQANAVRFAILNGVTYPTLAAFRTGTGQELNGGLVGYSIFADAEEPSRGPYMGDPTFFPPYPPGSEDLRLQPGSVAIDAGQPLANINDGWLGSAPDLGAYEWGRPLPSYGPGAEPVAQIGGSLPPPTTLRLSVSPRPSFGEVRLRWTPPEGDAAGRFAANLAIFDAAGRRVRSVRDLRGSSWLWDGRDEGGRPVASGVYWARVELAGRSATGRIVRMK